MAIYAIGDLQGCYDPFRKLLDKLRFDPGDDRLWLTGDLVNRGPKSLKTLRFVQAMGDCVTTVLGNHDLHLLALGHDVRYSSNHYGSLRKVLRADDGPELLDWLRQRPLAHYDDSLGMLMVHAGVPPQWSVRKTLKRAAEVEDKLRGKKYVKTLKHMYGNRPRQWSGKLSGAPRTRFIINALTRMRMIYPDGRLNFTHSGPPDKARKGMLPWYAAENPKWAGTRIVFGHWSALGLRIDERVIGLDTGCVWGRALTAVRLDDGDPPRVRRVKCR
ncbi:MAG: symmetrical bis(5'-nucleosyl)-tetraphosphatase [Woeseiaceae bacterium]|nr:symmetrical bis(5'-nucleosyl)-tetraphosphatase [Woeseiaceae bacterium]